MRHHWLQQVRSLRFNRYIVECKLKVNGTKIIGLRGFNRYIVECKYISVDVIYCYVFDLIDT